MNLLRILLVLPLMLGAFALSSPATSAFAPDGPVRSSARFAALEPVSVQLARRLGHTTSLAATELAIWGACEMAPGAAQTVVSCPDGDGSAIALVRGSGENAEVSAMLQVPERILSVYVVSMGSGRRDHLLVGTESGRWCVVVGEALHPERSPNL